MSLSLAQVTCPACGQPFGAPVEQVLDVDLDPSAKARLLSAQVNIISCPHCGAGGAINLPFIYHDASKELALVFMPMEAGRTDLERQQLIGSLTRIVMNQMPPEQRVAYLLDPQVFFTYENLVNRVLEADGITQEMLEAQKSKVNLLRELLQVDTPEEQLALVQENEALVDEEFFHLLYANLSQAEAIGLEDAVEHMMAVRAVLFEHTPVGQKLAAREEAFKALQEQPTREKLVELLIKSDDQDTRAMLISVGQSLVDYRFFQALTQRIEGTEDATERKQLEKVRQEVLDIRDQMKAEAQQVVDARLHLLRELMASEKPELLARRRMEELDELFLNIMQAQLEQAQQVGDAETASAVEKVWEMVMGLLQEQIPPELRLLTHILELEDADQVREILEKNRPLVTPAFLQVLERAEQELMAQEASEAAGRASAALAIARTIIGAQEPEQPTRPAPKPDLGGLEIAKR